MQGAKDVADDNRQQYLNIERDKARLQSVVEDKVCVFVSSEKQSRNCHKERTGFTT